jgi:hypothetical protein
MVCTGSYLKSVLRYKYLLSDTYLDTLYLGQQGFEDPWLPLEAKRGLRANKFGKHRASILCIVTQFVGCEMFPSRFLSGYVSKQTFFEQGFPGQLYDTLLLIKRVFAETSS